MITILITGMMFAPAILGLGLAFLDEGRREKTA